MRLIRSTPQSLFVAGLAALGVGGPTPGPAGDSTVPGAGSPTHLGAAAVPVQSISPRAVPTELSAPPDDDVVRAHSFQFTRVIYSGYGRRGRGGRSWAVDFPKADQQFLFNLVRMTNIDAYLMENPVRLDDPELRKFPFIYALEVGFMALTPPEVEGLRTHLLAGGFLFVDDFWGDREWYNFEREISQVLPEYSIEEIPLDHPAFSSFYDIDSIVQVPNVSNGVRGWQTHEKGGITPHVRGIFDENNRLMVLINWNTDLGDAWEWADHPYYPLHFSNFAWQMAINFIIYSMTH